MLATAPDSEDTPMVNSINVDELLESAGRSIQVLYFFFRCYQFIGRLVRMRVWMRVSDLNI